MPKVLPGYKQEAKRRIVEGAMKTFFRMGYQKTKMTDIGKDLGVSKGAIYQYFKSKEELFFVVVDHLISQRRKQVMKFLGEKGLEGLKSEEYFSLYLLEPSASLNFTIDLISESLNNEKLNKKLSGDFTQAIEKTVQFFDAYKEKGLIKQNVDSRKKAFELFGMLEGLKSLLFYGAAFDEVKQVWASFANNFLNELKET